METYIKLTEEDKKRTQEFAERQFLSFRNKGRKRSPSQMKHCIYVGKMAEIAYARMHGLSEEGMWGDKADPGWDFVLDDGTKVDVKCLDESYKSRVYFNSTWMNCNLYAAVRFNQETLEASYLGKIYKEKVKKVWKSSGKAAYIELSDFSR